MRLSRRSVLIGGGAAAAVAATGAALAQRPSAAGVPTPVAIRATAIDHLSVGDRDRRGFGALAFRSGLVLEAEGAGFGGFSALWRSSDGRQLVALADNAQWLTAGVETSDGRLSGLSKAVLAPVLGATGLPLRKTRFYDTEGFAIAGGTAYVAIERSHAVMRFDWGRDGVRSRGQPIPMPREAAGLPGNSGLEAIGVAPPGSPLAGALVAIAERASDGESAPTRGFVLSGPRQGAFEVARADNYDVTDMAFLPGGDLLLLERAFSLLGGLGARLRRIPAGAIRPGARIDGPVIFQSEGSQQIDNMEGICVHREGGETIVTLISDDNFRSFQRTLMLEFALVG